MTTMEANPSVLNFQDLINVVIVIVSIIAGIVTIFLGIKKFSLKIGNEFVTSYIDSFSNEYVEFRKFRVKLGFTIRAIKLPKKFDRESTVKLWFKPSNGFKQRLEKDDYDEDLGKNNKKIKIKDKEFIKSKEIELFHSQMIRKLSLPEISELSNKITVTTNHNSIKIENRNSEEIHNHTFDLPSNITYEDAPFYFDNEHVLEIKASLHEEGNPNQHISDPIMKMTVKKIPASDEHDNPGTINIPLPT